MLSISALAIFLPYPKRYLPFWLLRKSRVASHRQLSSTAEFTGFLMMGGTELELSPKSQGKTARKAKRGDVGGDQHSLSASAPHLDDLQRTLVGSIADRSVDLSSNAMMPADSSLLGDVAGAGPTLWAAIATATCKWFCSLPDPRREDLATLIEQLRRL